MKSKISLRLDGLVLNKFRQIAHGNNKMSSINSVVKQFLDKYSDGKAVCPLGFTKDSVYVVCIDEELMKSVEDMAKRLKTSKSDVIRIAIYDWYLDN